MSFTDRDYHQSTLKEAAEITAAYRADDRGLGLRPLACWRQILDEILAQPECEGIRLYPALNQGSHTLVHVGTDAKMNDLWQGPLAEQFWPCPPFCSAVNPLNVSKFVRSNEAQVHPDVFATTTGNEHRISLEDASVMIAAYRAQNGVAEVRPQAFGRCLFDAILVQPDCKGVRLYPAREADGRLTTVVVGVDAAMDDLYAGILGEMSWPCPPFCSAENPLNTFELLATRHAVTR